jgi:tRNA acetyltransferase TAN1
MGRVKHQQSARRNQKSNYFPNNQNSIQVDQHGFFVTFCSTKESFVRNEIYNLLNRFAEQLFGPEFSDTNETDKVDLDDLDSALENEKIQLKNSNKKVRRFQIIKSGTKHSFFVTSTLPLTSLNKLIELIFNTSIETKEQHSRYVERLLPISFICKAYDDDLRKAIIKPEFLEQILSLIDQNDTSINTIWFDVQAKKSNNTLLKSSQLEEIIINDLTSRKSEDLNGKIFKRDYRKPQIHILIHVIKNVILISVVRNYDLYKKYNLASINLATTIGGGEEQQQQQQQTKITFDDDDDDDEEEEKEENVTEE